MKKNFLSLLLIFIAAPSYGQPAWFVVTSPHEYDKVFIVFSNPDTGFLGGTTGYLAPWFLKRTTDGGKSWNDATAPFFFGLHSPFSLNTKSFFFIDGDSAIIRTNDGGTSWDYLSVNLPFKSHLYNIYFNSPAIGFLCGSADAAGPGGVFFKTVDSGKTWSLLFFKELNEGEFQDVTFRDSLHGYIREFYENMGNGFVFLLQTSDGGLHWIENQMNGYDLYFNKSLSLWIDMGNNLVCRFSEDGNFFECDTIFPDTIVAAITSMSFANDSVGFLCTGNGKIYKTTNSGKSWFLQKTPKEFYAGKQVVAVSESVAYALGDSVIIKTIDGGGPPVNEVRKNLDNLKFSAITNPIVSSADFQFLSLQYPEVFQLFDLLGRQVFRREGSVGEASLHIDMHEFPAGMYIARLGGESVKIIKE